MRCDAMRCDTNHMKRGEAKVFWGTPLTNGAPSKMEATAKTVKGDISEREVQIKVRMLSAVSLALGMMSLY